MRHAKAYPSREAAENSKKGRTGDLEAAECIHICGTGTWHLGPKGKSAATERKPQKDTGPDMAMRLAVYMRDGWACVCCGTPIDHRPHSVGHRKRRSQGGPNTMDNLLTFLGWGNDAGNPDDHHARIDSRKDPHDEAKGYSVRSRRDPALIPVMYFDQSGCGVSMYLSPDGSLSPDPPAEVA